MKQWLPASLLLCALAAAFPAMGDADSIKRGLAARMPGATVQSVVASPFAGLYEVVLDGEIVYTDEKMEYFFSGSIFDIRTMPPRNLTEANARRSTAGILAAAARDSAIKRVRGNGGRIVYSFEDPNCGFCKALNLEFARLDNVTIYTFPTPMLSQNSADKAVWAWCAKDRVGAWDKLMAGAAIPEGATGCAHPLAKIAALAKRFDVTSTPVVILGNGRRFNGFVSADNLEKALAAEK